MTITNLPSYPQQQYLSNSYHLSAPPATHPHPHPHPHPHSHVQPPHHSAYPPQHHHPHPQPHLLPGPVRTDPVTRKRPKYTRSKTGCLTCRVKKIKCDETKPTCTRCTHGQRECTWPENVPSRKKTTAKRESDETDRTLSPESASPSSSAPTTTRDGSPARKSPLNGLHGTEGRVTGRRTHSEPNTAAASPIVSPIDAPNGATSRRPSLSHTVRSSSSIPYSQQQLRPQAYPSLTPPSVSPASFHPSPTSSHDYPSYNGSPVSNGHSSHGSHGSHTGSAVSRHGHGLSNGQTLRSTLGGADSVGQWHTAPMMTSAVNSVEPYFRTVQERNLVGRSSASYAS